MLIGLWGVMTNSVKQVGLCYTSTVFSNQAVSGTGEDVKLLLPFLGPLPIHSLEGVFTADDVR